MRFIAQDLQSVYSGTTNWVLIPASIILSYLWRRLRTREIALTMLCSLGISTQAVAQSTLPASSAPLTLNQDSVQALATPLVIAGVHVPLHFVEWDHYILPEHCTAAFDRVLNVTEYADTLVDSVLFRKDPWALFPASAIQVARQCLDHFRVAELPSQSLDNALRLAIKVNDDSLIQGIVRRQLAQVHDMTGRIAVLDSTIIELAGGSFETNRMTAAHLKLAHAYLTQLDALGSAALQERINVRYVINRAETKDTDIANKLTNARDILGMLPPDGPDSLSPQGGKLFFHVTRMESNDGIAWLTYLQTFSRDDLERAARARNVENQYMRQLPTLLGTSAPTFTCDYYYNNHDSPKRANFSLPSPGKISILIFDLGAYSFATGLYQDLVLQLRKIHQEAPDVAITVVVRTEGHFRNIFYGGDKDGAAREAEMLHHFYTDSLGAPGAICVTRSTFEAGGHGHIVELVPDVWPQYRNNSTGGQKIIIVGPSGLIMSSDDMTIDLVDFIRRLHAKSATAAN